MNQWHNSSPFSCGSRYIGTKDIASPPQCLMSSLADTFHNNPVRQPSVSASVRNASRRLSDSRIGVCPMAGKRSGGFGSTYQLVPDGVIGYFHVVLHPRLQQDGASLLLIVSTLRHNSLAINLLPVKRFNHARDFPLEAVHS